MQEIQTNNQPTQPNITVTQPVVPPPSFYAQNKWSIWIIIASVLVLGTAIYFIFRTPSLKKNIQPRVTLSIDAPQTVATGSELIYKVRVKNDDSDSIKNVTLDLVYPQGFTFKDSVPKPTKLNGTQFGLPPLDPSQETTIMIKGDVQGNAGETKTLNAIMHYRFSNTNTSEFVASSQAQTQIKTADIAIQIDGPGSVNSTQDVSYVITYSNFTQDTISGFSIVATLPKEFNILSSEPKANLKTTWNIGDLKANQSGQIKLVGNFKSAHTGDQLTISVQANGSVKGNPSFALTAAQLFVDISSQPLSADISIDSTTDKSYVEAGDRLIYKVTYKNNSQSVATGVHVSATLSPSSVFDLESIQAEGAIVDNNVISWDAGQISELSALSPGDGGDLRFTVSLKNPIVKTSQKNVLVSAYSEIKSNENPQPFKGQGSVLKVLTSVDLSTSLTYYSGAKPPKVGNVTTYQVNIALSNSTNDVTASKLTLNLPNSASFDTKTLNPEEVNNVSYDKSTKKLVWNIGTVVAHAGEFVPSRSLQFNVSITPGLTNRGNQMTLVSNIVFNGTDSFISIPVNLTSEDITTANDPNSLIGVQ
ncbi:MAG: Uncharacterized protein G01um101477_220 [Candidatus Doudnabacteria bacterium Gr01-1014_77]|uniref:DUF11 domain-containing protein n=1 Tax=Candidatus Doudnabacteria bacterium Gr01-1014_77 TaxID=2017133 RepID=A0A554JCH4_9BACT|nr:MAG: Uncharacterized protein G01um101477_220 [Candidatus Doudnabacteria bacterium Gr01-1014_77]